MKHTPLCNDELNRLKALEQSGLMDTAPEREFDELTRLAATALGVRSAAISLLDDRRQWFKSRQGIPFSETSREVAFCNYPLASHEPFVVGDASQDERFAQNPLVTASAGIRFYTGMPLILASGECIGTLCVFDPQPRKGLSVNERNILRDLARIATDLIETRQSRQMAEIAAKVVEATSDAVLAADRDGSIVYWNAAAEKLFGWSADEALGQNVELIIPHRHSFGHRDIFARAAQGGPTRLVGTFLELPGLRSDGSEVPIELSLARWGDPKTNGGFAAIARDVSQRKALEAEKERATRFLDSVVSNLPAMLFVRDTVTREYVMINQAAEKVLGRTSEDVVGKTDQEIFPHYAADFERRDNEALASGTPLIHEGIYRREEGDPLYLRTTRAIIDGPERTAQYMLWVSEDVTDIRGAEAEIHRLAKTDALTGLLNRSSFTDRLERLTAAKVPYALLSIDLDRFKSVNDQFGHPVGDDILARIAERIRDALGPADWVARVGGDEFVAVLLGARLRLRAEKVAGDIIRFLERPIHGKWAVAHIGASIGAALFPDNGASTEELRQNVDVALYRAKTSGRGNVCFFDDAMDAAVRDRRLLEKDLRAAIADGHIELMYQPVMEVASSRISSVEALARWKHPDRGHVPPDLFISMAEECGFIDNLGEQLLHRACREAMTWSSDVKVAVNLSPMQFISGKLVDKVQSALEGSRLPARRLQLEVTEGLVIRDVEGTFAQLEALRALGISVLMDDFGVGYSSLSYFQRFHFDKVKIDRSFVDEIATSPAARAIITAVTNLGRELEMGIVAEGVETEE